VQLLRTAVPAGLTGCQDHRREHAATVADGQLLGSRP
jgi:hypothetical protein